MSKYISSVGLKAGKWGITTIYLRKSVVPIVVREMKERNEKKAGKVINDIIEDYDKMKHKTKPS
jgi:hypothetical protein